MHWQYCSDLEELSRRVVSSWDDTIILCNRFSVLRLFLEHLLSKNNHCYFLICYSVRTFSQENAFYPDITSFTQHLCHIHITGAREEMNIKIRLEFSSWPSLELEFLINNQRRFASLQKLLGHDKNKRCTAGRWDMKERILRRLEESQAMTSDSGLWGDNL